MNGLDPMTKNAHGRESILIVEDNHEMCATLEDVLGCNGYRIKSAHSKSDAITELTKGFVNVVLVDLGLPDGSGLSVLEDAKRLHEDTVIIIFTGYASVNTAIGAMNAGAFAYLEKPLNLDELRVTIKKGLDTQRIALHNKRLITELKELAITDSHTKLYNYRYFVDRLRQEIERARRYVLPLSLIMLDIDYFKSLNDVYGHSFGDKILTEFSDFLKGFVRSTDMPARYGGEEFVIMLTETDIKGAEIMARRFMDRISRQTFDPEGERIRLKVSAGLASVSRGEEGVSAGRLITMADKALLQAKQEGGNKYLMFSYTMGGRVSQEAIGVRENVSQLKEKLTQMMSRASQSVIESIYAFAKSMEAKDHYTQQHSDEMVELVTQLGQRVGLSDTLLEDLKHAACLHDLGKIGIPDSILCKKGSLTEEEYSMIKRHPQIGAEIIRPIHFLKNLVPIILYHHERYDGSGYVAGLKGKDIPVGARIVAIADVYQALVSDRPYRKSYDKNKALSIMKEGSGTQFDPDILKAFTAMMESK